MTHELDIRSLSVTAAAKLLKVTPKTVRAHIRRWWTRLRPMGYAGQAGGST